MEPNGATPPSIMPPFTGVAYRGSADVGGWCASSSLSLPPDQADRDSLYTMRGEFIRAYKMLNRQQRPANGGGGGGAGAALNPWAKACEQFNEGEKR